MPTPTPPTPPTRRRSAEDDDADATTTPPSQTDPIGQRLPPAVAARVLWLAASTSAPRAAETPDAARALAGAAAVCRAWRAAAEDDDALWRAAYCHRFPPPAGAAAAGLPPLASPAVSPAPTPSPSPRPPGPELPPPTTTATTTTPALLPPLGPLPNNRPASPCPSPSPRECYPAGGVVEAWLQQRGRATKTIRRRGGDGLFGAASMQQRPDADNNPIPLASSSLHPPPRTGAFLPSSLSSPANTATTTTTTTWRAAYASRHALDAAWRRLAPSRCVLTPEGGAGAWVNAARFGARGRVVVAGCADGSVGVYCARTGRPRAALLLGGGRNSNGNGATREQRQRAAEHAAAVWCVDAGDGDLAASGGVDSQVRVWSLSTGATQLRLRHVAGGDDEAVTSVQVLEQARAVLTSHARGVVALWDVRVGAPPVRLLHLSGAPGTRYARTLPDLRAQMLRPIPCYCAQLDAEEGGTGGDGATVVAGGKGGRLHLYDLRQGAKVARVDAAHEGDVFSMHLLGGRLATGAKDGSLKLWDVARLRALGGGGGEGAAVVGISSPGRAHAAAAAAVAASSSSGATTTTPTTTRGCPCVALSYEHDSDVFSCRLGGDWRLASASDDGTVKVWDADAAGRAAGSGGGGISEGAAGSRRRRRRRRREWRAWQAAAARGGGGFWSDGSSDGEEGEEDEGEGDDDDDGRCCRAWRSVATLRPAADGDPSLLTLAPAFAQGVGLNGGGGAGGGAGGGGGGLRAAGMHCVDISDDRMVVGGRDALLRIYNFGSGAEDDLGEEEEDGDEE